MKHEGWRIIPNLYDDGGFSGGNMDRPGVKRGAIMVHRSDHIM